MSIKIFNRLRNLISGNKNTHDELPVERQEQSVQSPAIYDESNEQNNSWEKLKAGLEKGINTQESIDSFKEWLDNMIQKCKVEGVASIQPKTGAVAGDYGADGHWFSFGFYIRPSLESTKTMHISCMIIYQMNNMCIEQRIIHNKTPDEIQALLSKEDIFEKAKPVWLELARTWWEKYN